MTTDSLIEYPSDFPIKIMGAMHDEFAQTMLELVLLHDPDFDAAKMDMRPSSKGSYLAITVTVRATRSSATSPAARRVASASGP